MQTVSILEKDIEAEFRKTAAELEHSTQPEQVASGADSSRFGADARSEPATNSAPYQQPSPMDQRDWKFGDPNSDPNKR